MSQQDVVQIQSRDYWFKVVEYLQQNWALVDRDDTGSGSTAFFFGDTSGVFDKLKFDSEAEAYRALRRNGFLRFDDDPEAQEVIAKPQPPFHVGSHPNGPIYSSGRYWI